MMLHELLRGVEGGILAAKGSLRTGCYWDMVPYTDMLLAELNLCSHRKASVWKDLFRPCFADDLAGLIDELKTKLNDR